jgi:predicted nucleic acid-binding protein
VARIVVLDSGPLGLAAMPRGKAPADACRAWLLTLEAAGADVVVPAVADYEVRRELIRLGAVAQLANLDRLRARFLYLPITAVAWDEAAGFWALLRKSGVPTAGPQDLDADAILAGQALTAGHPGDSVTIATTNVAHLGRFPGIDARHWSSIA